jgi:hypothetical protein
VQIEFRAVCLVTGSRTAQPEKQHVTDQATDKLVLDSWRAQEMLSFSLHSIQTGSGAHTVSYSISTEGCFSPDVKQYRHGTDHSPPSSAGVR